jgi:hypothetical protein
MSEVTAVIVVTDSVSWREPVPGASPPAWITYSAFKGQRVGMGPDALARHLKLGSVARPEDAQQAAAEQDALAAIIPAGDEGDEQLRTMGHAELIAYVGQHPTEAQRVFEIEQERPEPRRRVTVIRAAGFDPATGDPLPAE